jgi:hypothetical protein
VRPPLSRIVCRWLESLDNPRALDALGIGVVIGSIVFVVVGWLWLPSL